MLSNPTKPVIIYSVASIIQKYLPKAFTKDNVEEGFNVKEIYLLHGYVFDEDEFLPFFLTDRHYSQIT
jgi:hypothetical protein